MLSVYPVFYPRFACKAADCRHSCCRGWEIDVDEKSAARYLRQGGALGEALRAALEADEAGWHFRLDAEERCPFLRRDGLCRLICELGEDSLCDICALHPRFYGEQGDLELCGLGLSCEKSVELLLESREPLRFIAGDTFWELPALLDNLGLTVDPEALRFTPHPDRERYAALLARLEKSDFNGRTLTLKVKFYNFTQITRSVTVDYNLRKKDDILPLAKQLLNEIDFGRDKPIRLIGLSVSNPSVDNDANRWEEMWIEFAD